MLRKEDYVNMERYCITKRKQEARWRKRTGSGKYKPKTWTGHDDKLVLDHGCPDRELGKKLKRSVHAIQVRRCRLKKIIQEESLKNKIEE